MTKSVFAYRNGYLCVEAVPLHEIAEEMDSPFFCTSEKQLRRNYAYMQSKLGKPGVTLFYAVRTNPTLAVLSTFARLGAGAEVTNLGELERALSAGFMPHKILVSGQAKTKEDIEASLLAGVRQIQATSVPEIKRIASLAAALGMRPSVSLKVDLEDNKRSAEQDGFGWSDLARALAVLVKNEKSLYFSGLSLSSFSKEGETESAIQSRLDQVKMLLTMLAGQDFAVDQMTLGCGDDIVWTEDKRPYERFVMGLHDALRQHHGDLSVVMGRRLVGSAGILVARVRELGGVAERNIACIDINQGDLANTLPKGLAFDLIAARDSDHGEGIRQAYAIKGLSAHQDELFGENFMMPPLVQGDLVAVMNAGAYGSTTSLCSSGRSTIPEVLVSGAQCAVVRRRVSVNEQMRWEALPEWMVVDRAA